MEILLALAALAVGLGGQPQVSDLAVSPRLPVALKPATVVLDLRNPDGKTARTVKTSVYIVAEGSDTAGPCGSAGCPVPPMGSKMVTIPVMMPGPGRYTLEASVEGNPDGTVSMPLYVTSRELQFIWFGAPKDLGGVNK